MKDFIKRKVADMMEAAYFSQDDILNPTSAIERFYTKPQMKSESPFAFFSSAFLSQNEETSKNEVDSTTF